MGSRNLQKVVQEEMLPPWAVDPEVKQFLAVEGIELSVYADSYFLKRVRKQPLIILRRLRQNHL